MPDETKDKKLSQEEARTANLAKRFLRQASIATKNFRIFGPNHPVLKNNLHNSYELLKSILTIRESVTFTFMEGAYLIEETPLKELDLKTYSFLADVNECGIKSLTFLNGLTESELGIVLKIVSDGPAAIKAEGGLIDYLKRKNISNIKTDEIFFKKVTKKEEEASEAKKHLEDFLIINYLLGKSAISKDDIESLAGEISVNPNRMGKIISDIASSRNASDAAKGISSGIGFARSSIEKVASHIKNVQGKSEGDVKRDIGKLILALEPSLRSELLKKELASSEGTGNLVKDALSELSDEIIIELIVSDYVDKKSSIVEIKKLIERLVRDFSKRKKIFPAIEKRLLQKGVPKEACSKILYEEFWSDMSVDEKLKKIALEAPSYCVEIGIADEIEKLVGDLLFEKKTSAIPAITEKILANFQSADTAFKARALRESGRIFILLFESKDYPHKEKLLNEIIDEFGRTKEKGAREVFLKTLTALIKSCLNNKWYPPLPSLVNAAGYEAMKHEVFREVTLESLLKDILFSEKVDRSVLTNLSKEIGEDAKRALSNILMSILPDDFDSYKKRYAIANALKELGRDAETFLINNLSSEKADIVKNSLEALSEIGTEKSIPPIEALFDHKNAKIREHARIAVKIIKERL